MAPSQKQARDLLSLLFSGGGGGDPYANEKSMFATPPRVHGVSLANSGAPVRAVSGGNVLKPTPRPQSRGVPARKPLTDVPIPLSRPDNPNIPNPLQAAVDAAGNPVPPPQLWKDPGPYPGAMPATGNTIPSPISQTYAGQDRIPNIGDTYAGQERGLNIPQSYAGQDRMPNIPGRLVGQEVPPLNAPSIPSPVPQYPYQGGIPKTGVGVPRKDIPIPGDFSQFSPQMLQAIFGRYWQ